MKIMKQNKNWLILIGILAVALIIRIWNSGAIALWHDEAFSALLIQMPLREMMQRIALDVHPPLYYLLLRVWSSTFGVGLDSLRGFSVFFGFLSVPMLYMLVKSLTKNKNLALSASALLAVNAFHIQYSLEARMYTLGTFLILLSTWVMLQAVRSNRWKWWIALGILTAAAAYNHYFMFFSIAAQGLFLTIWWLKNRIKKSFVGWRWVASFVLAFVLYIPWLKTFWRQFSQVQDSFWIPPTSIGAVGSTVWKILLGGFTWADKNTLIASAVVMVILLLWYLLKRGKNLNGWILPVMGFTPFILALLFSLKTSLFLDRYFIFASVFMTATFALALYSDRHKKVSASIIGIIMIISVVTYTSAWQELEVKNKPGMDGASNYLTANAARHEKVVVSSTFIYFTHRYYNMLQGEKISDPKLYLGGISETNQLPHFSGTALLENKDFIGDLSTFALRGETTWLLWTTGFGGSKPEVPSNWSQLDEQKFPDVFSHKGDIFVTQYQIE